jgi:hypothetical protein
MKNKLLIAAKLFFVLLLCALVFLHKSQKPRILIIHSYLDDYSWVWEINEGFQRVFDDHQEVTLRYHYMDLKNHVDEDFRRTAAAITHRTIARWQPDILILSDDLAQKLIGTEYLNHPNMSIVFAGVNGKPEDYGYDEAANVTGILERKPLEATKDTLLMMAQAEGFDLEDPNEIAPRLVFIGDNSFTVDAEIDSYSKFDWAPLEWIEPYRADNIEEWEAAIQKANKHADLIMISDIRQVRLEPGGKELALASDVMELTETTSDNPILSMARILVMEDGGMMSIAASGYEQGEIAASMALQIALEDKKAVDIDIVKTQQFLIAVRESTLEGRNLAVPSIYEAFARATDNFAE